MQSSRNTLRILQELKMKPGRTQIAFSPLRARMEAIYILMALEVKMNPEFVACEGSNLQLKYSPELCHESFFSS